MTTIVTRSGKGSPLTNNEVDTNFTNLNTDKLETSGGSLTGAVSVVASTADALVRITQTGTGDALLVEDSANPDSSPFVVDASGNVGIGTTAPANKLTVSAASGAVNATVGNGTATNALGVTSGNAGLLGMTSNHDLSIYTNNTVRMTIQAGGNIGIGTSTPATPLNVSVSTTVDAVRITQTGAGNALVVEDSANPDATPFAVNQNGQVLIGRTTAPFGSTSLAIEQSAADTAPGNIDFSKNRAGAVVNSGDGLGRIRFWGYDGTSLVAGAEIVAAVDGTPGTNDMPGRLVFSTTLDGASSPTERMRIDNAGAVGIGTTSPDATRALTLNRTGNYGGIDFRVNNSSMARIQQESTGNLFIDSGIAVTSGSTIFRTANGNERMRIDNAGNVGIGTSSPSYKLEVRATAGGVGAVIAGANDGGNAQINVNSTFSSTSPVYGFFFNGTTGIGNPASNVISAITAGTETMRIDSSGNVGIGTTSPGSKLDVKGTLRLSGATSGYVGLAPAAAAGSTTYTLPAADGSSGQVLSTNGSGTLSWASASGSATGALKNVQVFTSSGTYTRTSGVTTAVVIAVGGGGGGKGASGKTAGGNGGNGGTTSFGAHVSAAGGSGSTGTTGGAGGTGGTGATIAIKGQGGGGSFAFTVGTTIGSLGGTAGGQGGGAGVRNNSAGNAGARGGGGSGGADTDGTLCAEGAYAGGGGGEGETCVKYTTTVGATETVTIGAGGTAGTGTRAGGAGGAGYIIVYEYS